MVLSKVWDEGGEAIVEGESVNVVLDKQGLFNNGNYMKVSHAMWPVKCGPMHLTGIQARGTS